MIVLLLIALVSPQNEMPQYLVLTDGKVMEIQGEPKFEGKSVYFTQTNGDKGMLPARIIDRDQTKTYNEQIKLQQEEAAALKMELEKSQASSEPAEKTINIRSNYDLPSYGRSSNKTIDQATPGEVPAVDENLIESPTMHSWTSSDPIYVSREAIKRYADGYLIEGTVSVNDPRGFRNVSLVVTAVFDNGTTAQMNAEVSPKSLLAGETGTVSVRFTESARILRTDYVVSGEMGADTATDR